MYDGLIQGRQIVESLKQACLLETGERNRREEETVRMHDVIREMALWMACEQGRKRNKFRVEVPSGDITVAPNAMSNAEKASLWGRGITTESSAGVSFSPNLSTLIVRDTYMKELPSEIFLSRDSLKVVDLMGNQRLENLPDENGCLENLEYLNIADSSIYRLPTCASQWKKLKFLIVNVVVTFPGEVISSLLSLEMFEQQPGYGLDDTSGREAMEREMLHELEGLKYIMDIRLILYSAAGVEKLLDSPKLQRCTTRLALKKVECLPDMLDLGTEASINHLERLLVDRCEISEIKLGPSLANNLCQVSILCCDGIVNLSSLIYVPNLSILQVAYCVSMKELIGEESRSSNVNVGASLFSSLTSLTLYDIPWLRSICPQSWDSLPFPSLKFMRVEECRSLRKLPLDSNTVSTIPQELVIKGDREWWDRLEWDTLATKDAFAPKFIET